MGWAWTCGWACSWEFGWAGYRRLANFPAPMSPAQVTWILEKGAGHGFEHEDGHGVGNEAANGAMCMGRGIG